MALGPGVCGVKNICEFDLVVSGVVSSINDHCSSGNADKNRVVKRKEYLAGQICVNIVLVTRSDAGRLRSDLGADCR
jgi:hypothetical protein